MFIIAFSFSFYMINTNKDMRAFATLYQSIFTSFVWMLGEFEYKDLLIDQPPTYLPWLHYFFFVLYVICVPIIFLNLLIGLAVGDIDRIQSSAELEVHARQVERLIQIERGFSKMLRKRTKAFEHTEYPNVKSSVRKKIVDFLVSLVTQARDREGKENTTLRTRLDKHEERITEVYTQLRKQTQQFTRVLQTIKHIEDYLNRTETTGSSVDTSSIPSLHSEQIQSRL
ncbi:transient receptor potential cation channel subfamily A member 1 [Exaiptasia diaphana]|uniref:Ion transport domain-containing protein n=1 Tax=Exaiptasia diaphana TaxID=2652724 RepID=A0A913WNX7_EXADI|nr:transient receptor potential cation channel subfamily A member 1 [Exaiptasia diaphana]